MLLRLDHLVIAVPDPDGAAAELEARVGLACTGSGRHPLWGTHNRLAWFGDTYAELIGIFDPSLTSRGPVSRAVAAALGAGRGGLVAWSVATDDVAGDRAQLVAEGADLTEIEVRSRTRPDGEVVQWQAMFPTTLRPDGPPFVIEHEPVGAEWGSAARYARAAFAHPAGGAATVTGLTLPSSDPAATAAACARTVGLPFEGDPPTARVGEQRVRVLQGEPLVDPATIDLRLESSATFDVVVLGVRWRAT